MALVLQSSTEGFPPNTPHYLHSFPSDLIQFVFFLNSCLFSQLRSSKNIYKSCFSTIDDLLLPTKVQKEVQRYTRRPPRDTSGVLENLHHLKLGKFLINIQNHQNTCKPFLISTCHRILDLEWAGETTIIQFTHFIYEKNQRGEMTCPRNIVIDK